MNPEEGRAASPPLQPPQAPRTRPLLAIFTSHWLAMTGLGLVITAIVVWVTLLPAQVRHGQDNPYVGIALATVAAILVAGMAITPLGVWLGRRRLAERVASAGAAGGGAALRRFLLFLLVTAVVNLAIASQATFRVIHQMESPQFCGSCHVMSLEARAFPQGPHAALLCVDCHVGNGAAGFIESKLAGTRQLVSVMRDRVEMPIPGAIEAGRMIPSRETCEECHWKSQPAAAKLTMIRRYAEDEANTPDTTLLTMIIGGTRMGGIHGAHHGEGVEIRFVATDARRQDIPLVEYHNSKTHEEKTFVRAGADAAALAGRPRVAMQCFDCHNRAAHAFEMPDRAVDAAINLGKIPADLPFVKKSAVELLKADYPTSAAAAEAIPKALAGLYAKGHPDVASARAAEIAEAGRVLAEIYASNVAPELKVTWGTYPDNRGHQTAPGCFRCHDGDHVTATGEAITKNCFKCHYPATVSETKPEVLQLLGLDTILKKLQKTK
jgi:NapC/NirT cytochrome c family protein